MDETIIVPTPERARRGVELVEKAIADEHGRPSQPYRCIDLLATMHRRGSITAEMREAGEEFQVLFRLAQLDPQQAADMSRPFVDFSYRESDPKGSVYEARESVWKTLQSVGGLTSTGGSCLWHVLGLGMSLKEWSIEQGWRGRRIHLHAAPMALITVLGILAKDTEKTA